MDHGANSTSGSREDLRLLQGKGRFVADLTLPGMVEMGVVRSPYAHARLHGIDGAAALAKPGVLTVVTAADLGEAGAPLPPLMTHPAHVAAQGAPALARDVVRYVGEPVAVVVAEHPYLLADALEAVDVSFEELPVVTGPEEALGPDAPRVHDDVPGNLAMHWTMQTGDVVHALAAAPLTVRERFVIERGHGQPMEPRGVTAVWDPQAETLTVWTSSQAAHRVRDRIAAPLGLAPDKVHVIVQDVGGAFGLKGAVYPEELLVPWLARRLGRPVRWVESRREHFVATIQDRMQVHEVEAGFEQSGRLLALRHRVIVDTGAYVLHGAVLGLNVQMHLPGPYAVPHIHTEMLGVYTNRTATGPWRGAGRPQANFVMERLMDRIAAEVRRDPVEVRRRNLIQPEQMPYATGLTMADGKPVQFDSGDYPALLDRVCDEFGYAAQREAQRAARAAGRLYGIGVCCFIESSAGGGFEGARVWITEDGRVMVAVGSTEQGQKHETAIARIVAVEMNIDPAQVTVVEGDTRAIPKGVGTFGSRSLALAGSAALLAAREVREKARTGGRPLDATHYFTPGGVAWSSGAVACAVEVDPETAQVRIPDYVVVHDCGTVLNPDLVDGQIIGGVSNGVGNTLYERLVYDERGQLLTGTLMDYGVPSAHQSPTVRTFHLSTPTPHNPLGVKGAGEGGIMAVGSVLAQAIEDALQGYGVRIRNLPILPEMIFSWLREEPVDAPAAAR